jgi:acetyl esterase/lipase
VPDNGSPKTARPESSDLHPDLREARLVTPPFHLKWVVPVLRVLERFNRVESAPGVQVTDRVDSRGARVRIYEPDERGLDGALLWIHGGGLLIGLPEQDNAVCSRIAHELGILVISVYYRRAPQHPYPAALEDCLAAWRWAQDTAEELGVDPTRMAIAGESAGAGLAACLAQKIGDEGGVQPRAQLLVYPMLDDRTAARRELDDAGYTVWTNRSNRAGWSAYLGQECGAEEVPEYAVAARRESLGGLPPAWIGVGTLDLFLGECREYARRLRETGVPCELHETPGAPHGFLALAPKTQLAHDVVSAEIDFLRRYLEV